MKHSTIYAVAAGFFLVSSVASAHTLAGKFFEKQVGQYLIDVGTDQQFDIQPGAPVRFDFSLLAADKSEAIKFTDVVVYITKNDMPFLDADIAVALAGPTLITYSFPESGEYTLQTTFYNGEKVIADAAFPLAVSGETVAASGSSGGRSMVFGMLIGGIIGMALGFFIARRFRASTV